MELKAFDIVVAEEGYCEGIVKYRMAVYDKYEADKVIAELKAQKAQAEDDCAYWKMSEGNAVNAMHETEEACMFLTKSERHQKYKRCLAMAWFCHYIAAWDNEVYVHGGTSDDRLARLYWKWEKRWLDIADQFTDKES